MTSVSLLYCHASPSSALSFGGTGRTAFGSERTVGVNDMSEAAITKILKDLVENH